MKTLTTESKKSLTFEKKYFVLQGNNGNHHGHNRIWSIWGNAFDTKKEANKTCKNTAQENGDIKFGLTPLRICTAEEIIEIINSEERINYSDSHYIHES
jgi:hypothetical protein